MSKKEREKKERAPAAAAGRPSRRDKGDFVKKKKKNYMAFAGIRGSRVCKGEEIGKRRKEPKKKDRRRLSTRKAKNYREETYVKKNLDELQ